MEFSLRVKRKNMYNDHWVWFAWIEMQTHMTCAISFTRFSFVSQYTFKLTHLTGTTFTTPQHIWSASIRYNNSKCTLINWFQSAHSDTHTWFILEGFCREPNKAHHFFRHTTNSFFSFDAQNKWIKNLCSWLYKSQMARHCTRHSNSHWRKHSSSFTTHTTLLSHTHGPIHSELCLHRKHNDRTDDFDEFHFCFRILAHNPMERLGRKTLTENSCGFLRNNSL